MHLLLSTIELRPYVFIFLASYLFISIINFGLGTTILFTAITYVVALACEWSSVHNGFPFGLYHYIDGSWEKFFGTTHPGRILACRSPTISDGISSPQSPSRFSSSLMRN